MEFLPGRIPNRNSASRAGFASSLALWMGSSLRSMEGDNKWADSVVALHASTGKFVWGFQVVHHDLWDYHVASQPTLFTWKDGTPAVAINTQMGGCSC
ncbi:MAG TPA: hypothetical protein VKV15_13815 [Bryobacteraceae bacterium]|nr:hypothetical protein [Bryobacteraceae bacterium]